MKKRRGEEQAGLTPTSPAGGWLDALRRDLETWAGPTFAIPRLSGMMEGWQTPRTDVRDAGDHYELVADVPGVPKDQVEVTTSDGRLEIRAEAKTEQEEEEKGYYHKEIGRRTYYRSLPMPEDSDLEHAEGNLQDGCLVINIPKKETTQEHTKIPVQ